MLKGRIALITGGNSGIGLETAKLFSKNGAKVIVTASSSNSFKLAKDNLTPEGIEVIQCNVSKMTELDHLYSEIKKKHQGLHCVFANAGVVDLRPLVDCDESHFDRTCNINFKGSFFTVQKALPLLLEGSSVILNSSVGVDKALAATSVYAATKAALRALVRTWTAEISPSKIRFNCISPAIVRTPIFDGLFDGVPTEERKKIEEALSNQSPSKRFGTVEEVANLVMFLASSQSSYIAGVNINVDGGFTA